MIKRINENAFFDFLKDGMKDLFVKQLGEELNDKKINLELFVRNTKASTNVILYGVRKQFEEFKGYLEIVKNEDHITDSYTGQVLVMMLLTDLRNSNSRFIHEITERYNNDFLYEYGDNKNSATAGNINHMLLEKLRDFKDLFKGHFSWNKLLTIYLRIVMDDIDYYRKRMRSFIGNGNNDFIEKLWNDQTVSEIEMIKKALIEACPQLRAKLAISFSTIIETEMIRRYYKLPHTNYYKDCPPIIQHQLQPSKNVEDVVKEAAMEQPKIIEGENNDDAIIMKILELSNRLKTKKVKISIEDK